MEADRTRSTLDPRLCPPGVGGASAKAAPSSPAAEEFAGRAATAPSPSEAFHRLTALLAEYKEYAAYFLSAKIDGLKIGVRNLGLYAALGVVGLIAGSATITTAVVLLLVGAAWGLGDLLWDQLWLGALIVGLLVLGGIGLGAWLGLKKLTASFKRTTVQKYEQRQNWERGQFGRNVADRAAVGPE